MSEFDRSLRRSNELLQRQQFEQAERELERAVALRPSDTAAQLGLAKLRYMRGDPSFARDLARAAARNRNDTNLQMQFAEVLRMTGDLAGAELLLRDLIARAGTSAGLRASLAVVLHEAGRLREALTEALAEMSDRPGDPMPVETVTAILLSLGRADEAMPMIRAERERAPLDQVWIAHEATAARLADDPAYAELYDYDRFVRAFDIEAPPDFGSVAELNAELEKSLSERHGLKRPPFNQSMRFGTQTTGNLVADTDPAIRAALTAFLKPIADYRARLGNADDHPLSVRNRGEAHYAGCWSVRLKARGFHVNHIHSEGWLSSAYYVSVPAETADAAKQSGWLKFGEPAQPVPGAGPARTVQPLPGRLVLFPSYMWHGTTAIHGTEPRLTMAFDVVTRQ
ncbi:tetratricopeptide repeat protein [Candidatus Rariloculus sp.]|uniref:tetratricopeptide repeat protein n=1 Tax=Candidatus Rariloculus sp. TaxID=3101265 RepID=UPI003D1195A2